jgi:hypothetical protein
MKYLLWRKLQGLHVSEVEKRDESMSLVDIESELNEQIFNGDVKFKFFDIDDNVSSGNSFVLIN